MTPASRTVGTDQLVDEMIFKFTYTIRMDWMLPGFPQMSESTRTELSMASLRSAWHVSNRLDRCGSCIKSRL